MKYFFYLFVFNIHILYAHSVDERLALWENHLKISSDSICPYLKEWEQEDYRLITHEIDKSDTVSLGHLKQLHTLWQTQFSAGTLSWDMNTLIYSGYAFILSTHMAQVGLDDSNHKETFTFQEADENTKEIISAIEKQAIYNYKKFDIVFEGLEDIGIKSFPFVSYDGLATYRQLNHSYGLKIPLIGLPLKISSYDGVPNVLPFNFFIHDVNHVSLALPLYNCKKKSTQSALKKAYGYYEELDRLIGQEPEGDEKERLEFALYLLGHEQGFLPDFFDNSHSLNLYDLENMCVKAQAIYSNPIKVVARGYAADHTPHTTYDELCHNCDIVVDSKKAERNLSLLGPAYVSKKYPGRTISIIEWITSHNLSKKHIVKEADSTLINIYLAHRTDLDSPLKEMAEYVAQTINAYNFVLISFSHFMLKGKIVPLWIDDDFNEKGLIDLFSCLHSLRLFCQHRFND